jgi:CRP/FNR family transcriptional regulator, cyclic AMP receptor protein
MMGTSLWARMICRMVSHPAVPAPVPPTPRNFVERLDADAVSVLFGLGRARTHPARSVLFLEGEHASTVHVIRAGMVKVSVTVAEREVILDVLGPGDLLGELSVLDDGLRSATAMTLNKVESTTIPASAFNEFLAGRPTVTTHLMNEVVRRLRDASRRQVEYGALDGVGRVCGRLVEMIDRFGRRSDGSVVIDGPLTQTDIAAWAGLSREAVVKALQTMRAVGWIRTSSRSITVVDEGAVRSRASFTDS